MKAMRSGGRSGIRFGMTALALLVFFGLGIPAGAAEPGAKNASSVISAEGMQQITALLAEKASRTPAQQKMDSQLLQAVRESRGEPMAAGVSLSPANVRVDDTGSLLVDISAESSDTLDNLIEEIEELGGSIVYPSWEYRTIRARIDLSMAETIAGFPEVRFIQAAVGSITSRTTVLPATRLAASRLPVSPLAARLERVRAGLKALLAGIKKPMTGTVNSEGDRTHRADDTRNTYGYMGAGLKIGVLSDSYNSHAGAAADIASGNLPGPGNPLGNTTPVTVVQDIAGGTDEGRAMLQIVHDLAPKAQLFFATADISEAGFAANIQALRNAPNNCDIIIDDVFYFDEPVFQDGIVAQAVNTVTAAGALYFSSAGNEGSLAKGTAGYFEGDFHDTGSPAFTFPGGAKAGTIHNFGTAGSPVNGDIITAQGDIYTLNWSDPHGASSNDYDLFILTSAGTVKASSTNIQNGTQNPYEQISPPSLAAGDRLVVFKTAAAGVRAFAINTIRGLLTLGTTGQTHGHSSAVAAFSVAATPAAGAFNGVAPVGPYPSAFNASNQVENFTSDGPRRVFFNADGSLITPGNVLFGTNGGTVRSKPDITAADGVGTTLPPASGLNPFYGTSAAAPHAGAIAGLLKSANPALTPAQIRTILTSTALDVESVGYDNISGFGIVQAFQAMQAVAPAPRANILLGIVSATEGTFGNGNGSIDPGETAKVVIQLTNPGMVTATSVTATLTTSTPGVTVTTSSVSYGSIAAGNSATNVATPFGFFVNSSVACGTTIGFTLTVTFGGGPSPQVFLFNVVVGNVPGANISSTLGTTPPTGPGFTSTSGQQTGRLFRSGTGSSCASPKSAPGLTTATGSRQFDAYTFTNTNATSQCVTVTLNASNGVNLYVATYNSAGFVPSNPNTNYLADPGLSGATQTYSFTAPAGQAFTTVVHDINVLPASGSPYTLSVSLAGCSAGPACTPVTITTSSIAGGVMGTAYSQSFAATGGSGTYTFGLSGTLPTGLTFSGNTLSGTPTQTGSFPITITATDVAGCPNTPKGFTLVIAPPVATSFFTITPCRALDTRSTSAIPAGGTITVSLTGGTCGVPTAAKSLALNLTSTQQVASGHITIYPANQPLPPSSTLNFNAGQTRANNAVIPLATDSSGTVKVLNQSTGTVQLIIDIDGYFQ